MADPNYDAQIAELVRYYKQALTDIQRQLDRFDLTDFSRANQMALLKSVAETLASLNEESAKWVEENIPMAARQGVANAILALGVVDTLEQAEKLVKFNRVNAQLVQAAVINTQDSLLKATQNVERRVKATVRQVVAEVMRQNLAKGINGRRTMSADTLARLRKKLGDSLDTVIIDAARRRWKPEVYVDMVSRTTLMRLTNEAAMNEAVQRGAYYGIISKHGAKDGCGKWEGKIVKLVPDAPGDYTYIGDIPNRELFHPNCRHTVTPIRDPNKYVA
jgi:hypothetical protein